MKYLHLFFSILKKDLIYLWRYKVNTISQIIFLTFVCYGIIFGVKTFSNNNFSLSSKEIFIGGYILWLFMMSNYGAITSLIHNESKLGTLEQIYINSSNIFLYMFLRCISIFFMNFIIIYVIIFLIYLLFWIPVDINILIMLPVIFLGLPSLWGISIGIGGLSLIFKRIDAISSIFGIILFSTLPYIVQKSYIASIVLPFGLVNRIVLNIFKGEINLINIKILDIILILCNNLFYVLFGFLIYKISEYYAKKYNKLAHH